MNQIKFNLVRILINLGFAYLICVAYLFGVQNSGLFQMIPATIFFLFVITICCLNVKTRGFINSLADGALCIFMYMLYVFVMRNEYDILSSDIWFIQLLRGGVTVTACIVFMHLVKSIVTPILKYAQIYSLVNDKGIILSIVGCITQFKSTISIPIFNWVLRKSFKEIFELVKDSAGSTGDNEQTSVIPKLLENLGGTRIGKVSSKLLKVYSEYPDECVLAYCYKNPEVPMFNATLQGVGIFLKNAPVLIGQIAAVMVMEAFVKVALLVILLCIIKTHGIFTITNCIFYFLLYYLIQFVLCNSIAEPILMSAVVKTYLGKAEKEEENLEEEVENIFPGADKLQRMFGGESTKKQEESVQEAVSDMKESTDLGQNSDMVRESVENQVNDDVSGTISAEDFKNSVI